MKKRLKRTTHVFGIWMRANVPLRLRLFLMMAVATVWSLVDPKTINEYYLDALRWRHNEPERRLFVLRPGTKKVTAKFDLNHLN